MSLCLECPAGRMEADEVVAAILGLGSPAYRYVFDLPYKTWSYLKEMLITVRVFLRTAQAAMARQSIFSWQLLGEFRTPTLVKSLSASAKA